MCVKIAFENPVTILSKVPAVVPKRFAVKSHCWLCFNTISSINKALRPLTFCFSTSSRVPGLGYFFSHHFRQSCKLFRKKTSHKLDGTKATVVVKIVICRGAGVGFFIRADSYLGSMADNFICMLIGDAR